MTQEQNAPMSAPTVGWISFKEAIKYLGISDSRLRGSLRAKELTCYRPGGRMIKFKKEDLDAWAEKQKVEAQPQT